MAKELRLRLSIVRPRWRLIRSCMSLFSASQGIEEATIYHAKQICLAKLADFFAVTPAVKTFTVWYEIDHFWSEFRVHIVDERVPSIAL